MEIWYYDITSLVGHNDKINGIIEVLPEEEIERIRKLRVRADQIRSAIGMYMVREKFGHLKGWSRDQNNNPTIDETNANFNISHSGNLVVVLFSENIRAGIDIEEINEVDISDFNMVMNPHEQKQVSDMDSFFTLWTKKEAVLKGVRSGFSIEPKEVYLKPNNLAELRGEKWFCQKIFINDEYICFIATEIEKPEAIRVKEFTLEN